jgi:hypothetical protein
MNAYQMIVGKNKNIAALLQRKERTGSAALAVTGISYYVHPTGLVFRKL